MSWYHRQFRDAARERYFKNMNMALYFHSSIADYYLGNLIILYTIVSILISNNDLLYYVALLTLPSSLLTLFNIITVIDDFIDLTGIWGGGIPKPFKYTEIQRHRFGLTDKEGTADRKVPVQPLVFVSADGSAQRYNLRKVSIVN